MNDARAAPYGGAQFGVVQLDAPPDAPLADGISFVIDGRAWQLLFDARAGLASDESWTLLAMLGAKGWHEHYLSRLRLGLGHLGGSTTAREQHTLAS